MTTILAETENTRKTGSIGTGVSFRYNGQTMRFEEAGVHPVDDTLGITIERRDFEQYHATEWKIWFENPGQENSGMISDICDCDTVLPVDTSEKYRPGYMLGKEHACVIAMRGMVNGIRYGDSDRISATEYELLHEYMAENFADSVRKSFANRGGRSSDGMMPFFNVTAKGAGVICAIGWTGDWKADFTLEEDGVRLQSGLQNAAFCLKPGEKIRTTSIVLMEYSAEEDGENKFRRLVKEHFSHKACTMAEREGLMAYELWGGLPSEEMKKRLSELKEHGISFEDLWIDAGWYGQCKECRDPFTGDWSQFTGDWEVNRRVHPEELLDVRQTCEETGMRMMLWVEIERATQFSKKRKEHPEWFLQADREVGNGILYYGNEEAYAYAYKLVTDYIEKYNMSCYRQDFNVDLHNFFAQNDEEGRRGITEIKHITGMYRFWEQLLEKFPGLIIDNCASGGRRIDIETVRRSIPFFRSDYQCEFNANPDVVQTHNANISRYLPYNGCTMKVCDLYALRSAYSSSFGAAVYNAVFQEMSEQDFALLKQVCDEYRSIRKYLSLDFYNHGTVVLDDTAWAIWQYHDPSDGSGIVMAFRRENSPFETAHIALKGSLPQNGSMPGKVAVYNPDSGEEYTTEAGNFIISLPRKKSSVVLKYFKCPSLEHPYSLN